MNHPHRDSSPFDPAQEDASPTSSSECAQEATSEACAHAPHTHESHCAQEAATAEMAAQIAELKDQLLRAMAETENVRRRAQRDVEEAGKYALTGFAREMVSVCDNLWRAADSIPAEARSGNDLLATIAQGVDMTLRELVNVLERFGIKRIDPMGQPFDHNIHQAVVQIEQADVQPGTVLQVMQAGYTLHERLLRPAMVGVAKRPEPRPAADASHLDTQA